MPAPNSSALDDNQRGALLEEICALGSTTDDATATATTQRFLPLPAHDVALHTSRLIVRGERGAGKTTFFRLLRALTEKKIPLGVVFPGASVTEGRFLEGFSERETSHPSVATLNQLAEMGDDGVLRAFWFRHLIGTLAEAHPEVPPPSGAFMEAWRTQRAAPRAWVGAGQAELGPLATWLDGLDHRLAKDNTWVFVTYDHLDRIGLTSPAARRRFVSTLLAMWLSLANRYERLRCKVFLREDLFRSAAKDSPDANTLSSRSTTLLWTPEDLYRVLIRHLSASEGLRGWLSAQPRAMPLTERPPLGWFPPDTLPEEGSVSQRQLVGKLAGELSGAGVTKGYTHRWMMNHLQDAYGRVVPRSLLNLVTFAAQIALEQGPKAQRSWLLHPAELQAALVMTSQARANELSEEAPVVPRLQTLRGMSLLGERDEIVAALQAAPVGAVDDGFGADGAAVFDELVRLGLLKVHLDGRVDVPDLYRYALGIKRTGGVPRPR